MNKLVLTEFKNDSVVYLYIPEGEGKPGRINASVSTGEAEVAERAENDEFGRYGHNAMKRIREYVQKKNLPIDAIQAWY
ncbi:MAG: hypothetical protein FWG70_04590 [Oscillospiraceae bacterium]|nr:hypothetical protein [Oscillospiraceae bacterium]